MSNVNDTYFEGSYKEIWRSIIPEEMTSKEVDFILKYFNLKKGDKVLDLMCGYGRHAIALARQGVPVTAVDNLADYIDEINGISVNEKLPVKGVVADTLQYKIDEEYDLAMCMGNSLNFFNAGDVKQLLANIHLHLKPRAHLLINTWSLAEIAIKSFVTRAWDEVNNVKHICESRYLFHPTRIESTSIFLKPDGSTETRQAIDYVFSLAEMESLLNDSGFALEEVYSIPGKKKFALGDPRAYIIAAKN